MTFKKWHGWLLASAAVVGALGTWGIDITPVRPATVYELEEVATNAEDARNSLADTAADKLAAIHSAVVTLAGEYHQDKCISLNAQLAQWLQAAAAAGNPTPNYILVEIARLRNEIARTC